MAADMAEKSAPPVQAVPSIASMPLLEYVKSFWQPDSQYVREKALAGRFEVVQVRLRGLCAHAPVVAELVNRVHEIAPLTGPDNFVMSIKPYHPICREYLWAALRSELAALGIDETQRENRNIVFHSLRHSFVTACRIAGLSDFETMTLSRHKDKKMLERYSHGAEAIDVREIGEKLEKSLLVEAQQETPLYKIVKGVKKRVRREKSITYLAMTHEEAP